MLVWQELYVRYNVFHIAKIGYMGFPHVLIKANG